MNQDKTSKQISSLRLEIQKLTMELMEFKQVYQQCQFPKQYLSLKRTEIILKDIFITRQTTYYCHKFVAKIMKINVGDIMT